ncbi:MAG: tRNA lysidine(34) synthetase TilS [Pontixanthobacter sp.]
MSGGLPAIDDTLYPDLIARFAADLDEIGGRAGRLGIAVSGGPDSVALLLLANALDADIAAITVDHRLRPESAREAAQVAEICAAIGVEHAIVQVEVAPGNRQARARDARYAAIADWAQGRRIAFVATAHHADDQAETLMMRLNRSSGLSGLAGVRRQSTLSGTDIAILRPLLKWRKAELERIAQACPFAIADDPTNRDMAYDRAAMRQQLSRADWIDPAALAQSAALLGEAEDYVRQQIARRYADHVRVRDGEVQYRPGPSRFENIEIVRLIIAARAREPGRADIDRLIDRLESGRSAQLGGILAKSMNDGEPLWSFAPEPPRRGV